MAITRSNSKKTTPPRKISTCAPPLAPSRKGGARNRVRGAGRNLLGAFTAALTPRTPVQRSPVLRAPPAIRRKGSQPFRHVAGRILFAETPRKMTPSALLAPNAPLKAAAPPSISYAEVTTLGDILYESLRCREAFYAIYGRLPETSAELAEAQRM